jgi:hypothetical protein
MNKQTSQKIEAATLTLVGEKIDYGSVIKVETFERLLNLKRDTKAFQLMVSDIRNALCSYGLYLSGEGVSETESYEILSPQDNQWIGKLAIVRAERDLEKMQRLLRNTRRDGLSDSQIRRHEATLREISFKLDAMRRAQENEERYVRDNRKLLSETPE